ncbi:hypothetical protein ILUMI_18583, partial [Ignelater luminosus]
SEKPDDPLRYVCDKLLTEVLCNKTLESLIKLRDEIVKLSKKCKRLRHLKELMKCNEPVPHTFKRPFGVEECKEVLNSESHIEFLQENLTAMESDEQMLKFVYVLLT